MAGAWGAPQEKEEAESEEPEEGFIVPLWYFGCLLGSWPGAALVTSGFGQMFYISRESCGQAVERGRGKAAASL